LLTAAVLNNPSTYEIINPADFGLTRYVHFASRLTGWNAIKSRADQLNLQMTDAQYKECTAKVKALADVRKITLDDTDAIIRAYHHNLHHDEEVPLLEGMTAEEKKKFVAAEQELAGVKEKRQLEETADAINSAASRIGLFGVSSLFLLCSGLGLLIALFRFRKSSTVLIP
jgi:homocitrate synthase